MTRAGPEHAAALAAIHGVVFPDDPWTAASFQSLLQQPGVAGFIDKRGGMILIRGAADEAEILTIGVAVKGLGIGKALMDAAIAHLKTQNITTVHLEVAASNAAARALYARLGFAQTGRRRNYYPDGADALVLSLQITPAA